MLKWGALLNSCCHDGGGGDDDDDDDDDDTVLMVISSVWTGPRHTGFWCAKGIAYISAVPRETLCGDHHCYSSFSNEHIKV